MAGGIGSRFWPYSRRHKPKQFLDVLGCGRSLLQMTFDRFSELAAPEQFVVITYSKYLEQVKEQLPELEDHQIISEPSRKNTATCIAYATYKIFASNPDAHLIITPADHLILEDQIFRMTVKKALKQAKVDDHLVTIGVKPNRPETGYGYIQYLQDDKADVKKVKTFTEKPNQSLAKTFVESGDFVWNSGIFIWKASSLISALKKHLPDTAEAFEEGLEVYGTSKESSFVRNVYTQVKSISIDYGVMEKSEKVYVALGDFRWSDLGSWQSLYELRNKDAKKNVVEANALLYDTQNSFIKMDSNRLIVVKGLSDYLINEEENVLLICPMDSEKEFRTFVADAKKKGTKFI